MMAPQLHLFSDGTIGPVDGWQAPRAEKQKQIMEKAFRGFTNGDYNWENGRDDIKNAVVKIDENCSISVSFALKALSGGGRAEQKDGGEGRPGECRMQISPGVLNQLVAMNDEGKNAYLIGVYVNEDTELLVVLKPKSRSNGKAGGSTSKQIRITTMAKALQLGIAEQAYPNGLEIIYAMRPEVFRLFLVGDTHGIQHSPVLAIADKPEREESIQRNLIYFGAPGTGKSFQLNLRAIGNQESGVVGEFQRHHVRRVTFHPDYTYAQFVGCYKPYTDSERDNEIGYRFIAGPFLETYLDAITHPENKYLLLIEELNRANPAAVFGDVFQLLDRNDFGESEYPIAVPDEMADCIQDYLSRLSQDEKNDLESRYDDLGFEGFCELSKTYLALPRNMFIWATMNSADQGVFPMDTAFKRRWDFHYIGIDEGEDAILEKYVPLGKTGRLVLWNDLRHAINGILKGKVNEDKLLGPFFIKPDILDDSERFKDVFKSKVLLYLYEDAAKTKRRDVFKNGGSITYSELCDSYDLNGEGVFVDEFEHLRDYGTVEPANADEDEADTQDEG